MPVREQMDMIDRMDSILEKAKRVDDYIHLKELYQRTCTEMEQLKTEVPKFASPRNPREDMSQKHDKFKLEMLTKQKTRLEKQMSLLEEQIKIDIQTQNTQTT